MSHVKNVEAFEKLKGICTGYGGKYNPGSPNLLVPSMTILLAEARQALTELYSAQTLFDNATNNREVAFKEMRLRTTRIFNLLVASGTPVLTLNDARSRIRKITSQRKTAELPVDETNNSAGTPKKRSTTGRDYGSYPEHFAKLVETVSAETRYAPKEPELTIEALNELLGTLRSLNEEVVTASATLSAKRQNRDRVLYRVENNLYRTAQGVKAYVKGAFGFNSASYKEVAKIKLVNYR